MRMLPLRSAQVKSTAPYPSPVSVHGGPTPLVVSQPSSSLQTQLLCQTEFGGQFVITEAAEASTLLFKCINKFSLQEYICKVVPSKRYQDYLAGYLRLDGNPGINSIESVFVGPKQTYIVFAQSFGDLHDYVRSKKRLKESEVCRLFKQIATIVHDCHENGIVLRDLKLRKFVFRDRDNQNLKLETLDDAVVLGDPNDDLLGDKHGCPAYVSPEILATINGRYSGRAADCWSLGVILYTMLVGRYPFHDSDPSLLFGKIRRGLFHIPNTVSPLAKCLIKSLLRKDPDERLTSEDLLSSSWFTLMSSPNTYYHKHHAALCAPSQIASQSSDTAAQEPSTPMAISQQSSGVTSVSPSEASAITVAGRILAAATATVSPTTTTSGYDEKVPDQQVPDL